MSKKSAIHKLKTGYLINGYNEIIIPFKKSNNKEYDKISIPILYTKDVHDMMMKIIDTLRDEPDTLQITFSAKELRKMLNIDITSVIIYEDIKNGLMKLTFTQIKDNDIFIIHNMFTSIHVNYIENTLVVNISEITNKAINTLIKYYNKTVLSNILYLGDRISMTLYTMLHDVEFLILTLEELDKIISYGSPGESTDIGTNMSTESNFPRLKLIKNAIKLINEVTNLNVRLTNDANSREYLFDVQRK